MIKSSPKDFAQMIVDIYNSESKDFNKNKKEKGVQFMRTRFADKVAEAIAERDACVSTADAPLVYQAGYLQGKDAAVKAMKTMPSKELFDQLYDILKKEARDEILRNGVNLVERLMNNVDRLLDGAPVSHVSLKKNIAEGFEFLKDADKAKHKELDFLYEALEQAREWFSEYATMHQEKGNEEKAKNNIEKAEYFNNVLLKARNEWSY